MPPGAQMVLVMKVIDAISKRSLGLVINEC